MTVIRSEIAARPVSPAERRVWALVAEGRPNKMIAHLLSLREATVKIHITHLLTKTDTTNRVQLALRFHRIPFPTTAAPAGDPDAREQ